MKPAYIVHGALRRHKQRISCSTAVEAVSQRERLLSLGWGVNIADPFGMPISDARMNRTAFAEAASLQL